MAKDVPFLTASVLLLWRTDDVAFIDKAIALGRFSLIPGTAFGAPGHLRFGYAGMGLDNIERLRQDIGEVADAMRAKGQTA